MGFLFRRDEPLIVHHDDVDGQKQLLREIYAKVGWETPRLLDYLDECRDFYFDSFSQIRMDTWSRGRITLVGDAGYGPAPAVGGGTSLAAVAAYVLARELAEADGDYLVGLRNYRERDPGRGDTQPRYRPGSREHADPAIAVRDLAWPTAGAAGAGSAPHAPAMASAAAPKGYRRDARHLRNPLEGLCAEPKASLGGERSAGQEQLPLLLTLYEAMIAAHSCAVPIMMSVEA